MSILKRATGWLGLWPKVSTPALEKRPTSHTWSIDRLCQHLGVCLASARTGKQLFRTNTLLRFANPVGSQAPGGAGKQLSRINALPVKALLELHIIIFGRFRNSEGLPMSRKRTSGCQTIEGRLTNRSGPSQPPGCSPSEQVGVSRSSQTHEDFQSCLPSCESQDQTTGFRHC